MSPVLYLLWPCARPRPSTAGAYIYLRRPWLRLYYIRPWPPHLSIYRVTYRFRSVSLSACAGAPWPLFPLYLCYPSPERLAYLSDIKSRGFARLAGLLDWPHLSPSSGLNLSIFRSQYSGGPSLRGALATLSLNGRSSYTRATGHPPHYLYSVSLALNPPL